MSSPLLALLFVLCGSALAFVWRYKWEIAIISTSLWAVWYINAHPDMAGASRAIITCYFMTQVFKTMRRRG